MNRCQQTPVAQRMLTTAVVVFGLIMIPGCSKDDHGDDDHHDEAQTLTEPHSFADAVQVIHGQLEKIEGLIKTQKLDQVHAEAAVIRDVANVMAKLAAKTDSGVPSKAIREVNLTAKVLAAKFGPIDEAGDSGDLAATRKVYDEMVALFESLEELVDPDLVDEDHDHG